MGCGAAKAGGAEAWTGGGCFLRLGFFVLGVKDTKRGLRLRKKNTFLGCG